MRLFTSKYQTPSCLHRIVPQPRCLLNNERIYLVALGDVEAQGYFPWRPILARADGRTR